LVIAEQRYQATHAAIHEACEQGLQRLLFLRINYIITVAEELLVRWNAT
jgi:hypothetical protein